MFEDNNLKTEVLVEPVMSGILLFRKVTEIAQTWKTTVNTEQEVTSQLTRDQGEDMSYTVIPWQMIFNINHPETFTTMDDNWEDR